MSVVITEEYNVMVNSEELPYILKSNPHPNLIRTQVFDDFLNEKS
jgi:hypothetical protein